jgi:hypothetical protein
MGTRKPTVHERPGHPAGGRLDLAANHREPAVSGRPSYLRFEDRPRPAGAKTRVIAVHNRRHGDLLGVIRWFGPWRQYIFEPFGLAIYSADCLADIQEALQRAQLEHRRRRGPGR